MKVFVVACFAFSAMIVLSNAEHNEEYQQAMEACLKDMKISTDDFEKMLEEENENIACIFACIYRKLKVFDGEKFDAKKIHEQMEKEMNSNKLEYTKSLKAGVDKCIEEGNNAKGNECEKSGVLVGCLYSDEELVKAMSEDH